MGLHLESSELEVRGVPSHLSKVGHYKTHDVVSLIFQRASSDVSIGYNHNAPFGIKEVITYMPPSFLTILVT